MTQVWIPHLLGSDRPSHSVACGMPGRPPPPPSWKHPPSLLRWGTCGGRGAGERAGERREYSSVRRRRWKAVACWLRRMNSCTLFTYLPTQGRREKDPSPHLYRGVGMGHHKEESCGAWLRRMNSCTLFTYLPTQGRREKDPSPHLYRGVGMVHQKCRWKAVVLWLRRGWILARFSPIYLLRGVESRSHLYRGVGIGVPKVQEESSGALTAEEDEFLLVFHLSTYSGT